MKVLEELIRDLDRKIARAKERAEAESTSKPLKPDDAARLAEMQARAKGEQGAGLVQQGSPLFPPEGLVRRQAASAAVALVAL